MENAIILASHGDFAKAALESLEMIVGKLENTKTLALRPGTNLNDFIAMMESTYQELDTANGAFIFTDIYGGTPSNAAGVMLMQHPEAELKAYSGLNLSVLLETALLRELPFEEFSEKVAAASKGIWTELGRQTDTAEEKEEDL